MRILYDYQFTYETVSGASRSYCEIANILKRNGNDVMFSFLFSNNIFLRDIHGLYRPLAKKYANTRYRRVAERCAMTLRLLNRNYDIMHATGELNYFKGIIKTPVVGTIHDMIPENYMSNSDRIPRRIALLKNSERIVCVSNNTKKELLETYPWVDEKKIDVVYHGIQQNYNKYSENIWGDYIFFVGQRHTYKNFQRTLKALVPLFRKYKYLKMYCTGASFSTEELNLINQLALDNQIKNTGYIDNETLFSMYHHARLFVFPSIYEGFGIPILEAFTNGCPACISDSSCFPEIGGDAVAYFDPQSEDSILNTVTSVLESDTLAEKLRNLGLERVKNFTWEKSANAMFDCYRKALL